MTLKDALTAIGKEVVGDAKYNLQRMKHIKTGNLYRSVKSHVISDEQDDTLSFSMLDYGKYTDQGRRPNPKFKTVKKGAIKADYWFSMAYEQFVEDDLDKSIDAYMNGLLDTMTDSMEENIIMGF